MSIERMLKNVHSWLGVLILPWVVAAGFTGFSMNHRDLVLAQLPFGAAYDAALFDGAPLARPVDEAGAERIAALVAPGAELFPDGAVMVKGRPAFVFVGGDFGVTVDAATGYARSEGRYVTQTHAPDGERVHTRIRWSRVLSSVHERGWVGSALGTWLADIAAGALVVFGLTGLVLFVAPRLRRMKNRRAKAAMMAAKAR